MVVSNTSPLIALAEIGLLHLVPKLYGTISLPGAVLTKSLARERPVRTRFAMRSLSSLSRWKIRRCCAP